MRRGHVQDDGQDRERQEEGEKGRKRKSKVKTPRKGRLPES